MKSYDEEIKFEFSYVQDESFREKLENISIIDKNMIKEMNFILDEDEFNPFVQHSI